MCISSTLYASSQIALGHLTKFKLVVFLEAERIDLVVLAKPGIVDFLRVLVFPHVWVDCLQLVLGDSVLLFDYKFLISFSGGVLNRHLLHIMEKKIFWIRKMDAWYHMTCVTVLSLWGTHLYNNNFIL